MTNELWLLLALIAGLILGAFFFGGLWWTLSKLPGTKYPAVLLFGSLILRTLVVLVGFYFISGGDWHRIIACALGFTVARLLLSWQSRRGATTLESPLEGVNDENHS